MALAGAALILKVEDERSPYQALILNLGEQYEQSARVSGEIKIRTFQKI